MAEKPEYENNILDLFQEVTYSVLSEMSKNDSKARQGRKVTNKPKIELLGWVIYDEKNNKILKKISPKDAPDLESAMVIARNMAKRHGKVAVERIQKEHKIMRTIEF